MSLQLARVVHGYHGCDQVTAEALLSGQRFKESTKDYDWLGHGAYFWEFGPDRAMRWAMTQKKRKKSFGEPAVVGAIIQLGNCFDLLDTRYTNDLKEAFPLFRAAIEAKNAPMPENKGPGLALRFLDCAVINWYLDELEELEEGGKSYDTVRGCFIEGDPVFNESAIYTESHIQIAVRNPECILGVFRPLSVT